VYRLCHASLGSASAEGDCVWHRPAYRRWRVGEAPGWVRPPIAA